MKWILFVFILLSSCSVYLPDCGVPCTSVSDLEQMVVETPEGPDLFFGGQVPYLGRHQEIPCSLP